MSVIVEVLFWAAIFLGTAVLLFCSVYSLILFSDLTVDHINPIELCDLVNGLVIPEYAGHLALTLIIFARGFFVPALLNVPLIVFHAMRYKDKKHLLDNTSIFNDVGRERRICEIKLGYHLVLFLIYLYFFVITLIAA